MKTPETEDREIQGLLGSLREDSGADDSFRATLHGRLVDARASERRGVLAALRGVFTRWPGIAWPATGVAAGAAAFALLVAMQGAPPVATTEAPSAIPAPAVTAMHVPVEKVAVIRVNFSAEITIEDVQFEVTLPDGLRFWSRGERLADRSFTWRGRLSQGDNLFPIAVRGERAGRYHVKAAALVDGRRIEHDVVLDVGGDA